MADIADNELPFSWFRIFLELFADINKSFKHELLSIFAAGQLYVHLYKQKTIS
jgi:hypothetical protein